MCVTCVSGAMTAGAAATGVRVFLIARLGRRARRALTAVLPAGAVVAAGLVGPTP